jgi:hypothetical protein
LIDSGSTDNFMDYTFGSQASCPIIATMSRTVKIAGGDSLTSDVVSGLISYTIQKEEFTNEFKLLQLNGYEMIFGCD